MWGDSGRKTPVMMPKKLWISITNLKERTVPPYAHGEELPYVATTVVHLE